MSTSHSSPPTPVARQVCKQVRFFKSGSYTASNDTIIYIFFQGFYIRPVRKPHRAQTIAVSFEKRLIFMTFSPPTAGRKYTDKFTFEDFFKA
ncbi:MAG: hypothetical protein LBR79_03030 [Oscillospiraceae bacterium]|jgi:hypothetical protein|nr:hypothetical protein [Oscillospiraceae bacterium]